MDAEWLDLLRSASSVLSSRTADFVFMDQGMRRQSHPEVVLPTLLSLLSLSILSPGLKFYSTGNVWSIFRISLSSEFWVSVGSFVFFQS